MLVYLHKCLALFQRNDPFAMPLHPLESAGLLMRSRTEWLKGLGTEVTGSLGKEEARAGSRQNTLLGCGHGGEAARDGCSLKQEVFLALGRHKTPQQPEQSELAVPVSLGAEGKSCSSDKADVTLIQSLLRNDKDPAQAAAVSQHPASFRSSGSIPGEKSAIDLLLEQNYTGIMNPCTLQELGGGLLNEPTLRYIGNHQYPFILQSKVCARTKEMRLFPRPGCHLPFSVGDCQPFHKISKAQQHFSDSLSTIQRNLPL